MTAHDLGSLLQERARALGNRPFVEFPGERRWSYAEFNHDVNRVAHGLAAEGGVAAGSPVAIMMRNSIEFLTASYALKKLGAIEVAINTEARGPGLIHALNLTGAKLLLADEPALEAVIPVRENLQSLQSIALVGEAPQAVARLRDLSVGRFADLYSAVSDDYPPAAIRSDIAAVLLTSGTTGPSKGCMLSHRYPIRMGELIIEGLGLRNTDCLYCPYPLYHIDAAYLTVVPALLLGARAAIGRRFSASGFWPEAHSVGATVFDFMGPTLSILSKREDSDAARENSVRLAWGGPMPPNAERSALEERWGLKLVHLYGSTDAGAVCWESLDGAEPEGSCGRPKFPYEVRIVDRFDDEVPRGTVGELTIRPQEPDLTMQGYWGMPNETLATFRNLWLHTGDLGRVDDRGHLFYAGRLKDSIRRRGENISAWEIEQVLSTHPAILECAAFGVPSELSEEEVMAAIVVREGGTLRAEDAREFCRGKMAKYMVPEHIEFVESIPKTPTGKPQKVELARMLGLARARRARPGSRA